MEENKKEKVCGIYDFGSDPSAKVVKRVGITLKITKFASLQCLFLIITQLIYIRPISECKCTRLLNFS